MQYSSKLCHKLFILNFQWFQLLKTGAKFYVTTDYDIYQYIIFYIHHVCYLEF